MAIETLNITALRAKTTNTADIYYTTDPGQEGEWRYDSMDTTSTDNTGTILVSVNGMRFKRIIQDGVINVTWFGAKGNNNPNDAENNTVAFNKASVVLWGVGGELVIPSGIYYVGSQSNTRPASTLFPDTLFWTGENVARFRYGRTIIDIRDCVDNPVRIKGNGAVLKYRPDMLFGAWQGPINGNVQPYYASPLPSEGAGNVYKSDVGVMINLIKNTSVEIEGVVLDGNIQNQLIGGQWGDSGYQCEHIGIRATGNEQMSLTGLEVRNFGLDGVYLTESLAIYAEIPSWERPLVTVLNCNVHNNGRQAMSVAGGKGLYIANSRFNDTGNTGHSGWVASLGAGIDFETESGVSIEQVEIVNCEFSGNQGAGVIMTPLTPPIRDLKVDKCKFVSIGGISRCFYGKVPNMRFNDCEFIGFVEASYTGLGTNLISNLSNVDKLAKFNRCTFKDAMNSPSDSYLNGLFVSDGCIVENSTFIFNNEENVNPKPSYILRAFHSIIKDSTIIINDSSFSANSHVAHFFEMIIDNLDVVIKDADVNKGWYIEDHYQTNYSNSVKLTQSLTRITPRPYWYNTWADNGSLDKRISSCIYVDGTNGNDNNYGFSEQDPLKTFDEALIRVQNQSTISPVRTILIKASTVVYKDLTVKKIENCNLFISQYGNGESTNKPVIMFQGRSDQRAGIGQISLGGNVEIYIKDVILNCNLFYTNPADLELMTMFGLEGCSAKVSFQSSNGIDVQIGLGIYNLFQSNGGIDNFSIIEARFTNISIDGDGGALSPWQSGYSNLAVNCIQHGSVNNASSGWQDATIIMDNF